MRRVLLEIVFLVSMVNLVHVKTLYTDTFYNSKILYTVISICTNVQFSLNLNSLQQIINLKSNYLGTYSVVVKRVYRGQLYRLINLTLWKSMFYYNIFKVFTNHQHLGDDEVVRSRTFARLSSRNPIPRCGHVE